MVTQRYCAIIYVMKTKPLIETNPYLQDPVERDRLISRSVRTSCGVEGIYEKSIAPISINIPSRGEKKIYKTLAQRSQ
jgi:hypothetical protein